MADRIEQVIALITQIDPDAARRVADELRQMNAQRLADVRATEQRIQDEIKEAFDERMDLARRELNELEDRLVSRYDKEMEQLKRLQDANKDKYQAIIDKARQAHDAQLELSKALTDRELDDYKKYLQNREILYRRQADLERSGSESGANPSIFGRSSNFFGEARQTIGNLIGFGMQGAPNTTQEDKQLRIQTETLENVIKSRTPLEAIVNIATGILKYVQLEYEENLRRSKEALRAAGGTLQFEAGQGRIDDFEKLRKELENDSRVLRDNMKQVDAVITELGRSRVIGFSADVEKQKELFQAVRQSADLLGENWAHHAKTIGDLSRKEVDARTGANMSIQQGVDNVNRVFQTAQQVAKQYGEIDLQSFVRQWQALHDSLRPFGYTMDDTTKIMARFGKELDRGVISLGDLVQWSTGVTKADDANRAFLFQQILKATEKEPVFRDLHQTLQQAAGQGPLAQSYLLEALTEGNTKELKRLGLSDAGIDQVQNALQYTQNNMANQFSGGQGGIAGAAASDYFWRQFLAPVAGQQLEGKTIEARRALTERGAYGEGDPVVSAVNDSKRELEKQTKLLDQIVFQTRREESRGGIINRVFDAVGLGPDKDTDQLLSDFEEQQIAKAEKSGYGETVRAQLLNKRRERAARAEKMAKDFQAAEQSGDYSEFDKNYGRGLASPFNEDFNLDKTQRRFIDDKLEPSIEKARQRFQEGGPGRLEVNVNVNTQNDPDLQEKLRTGITNIVDDHLKKQETPLDRAIQNVSNGFQRVGGTP